MCAYVCVHIQRHSAMNVKIEINLWVAEFVECEVITATKPRSFGSFECVNSKKGNKII